MKKINSKVYYWSEERMDVNVEISSKTLNCHLYQIKEPKNDFRCRFHVRILLYGLLRWTTQNLI